MHRFGRASPQPGDTSCAWTLEYCNRTGGRSCAGIRMCPDTGLEQPLEKGCSPAHLWGAAGLLWVCAVLLQASLARSLTRSLTHSLTGVQCDLEFSSSWVCGHSGHGRPVQPGMAQVEPIPAVQPSCSRSVDPSHTCTIGIAKACKCIQVGRCNM